jgi:hypothetical protein
VAPPLCRRHHIAGEAVHPNAVIDAYHAQLALAGWSVGDTRGTRGWYVYGRNGENVIDATAATPGRGVAVGVRAGSGSGDAERWELTGSR